MTALRYAYLHGFASSDLSYKGCALRDSLAQHDMVIELPDLNAPSFERLTYTAALAAIDTWAGDDVVRLIGSSMGGYLAARWAEANPRRVDRLVLLCPGFDLAARWPEIIGLEAMKTWEATGFHERPDATGQLRRLHYGFISDALTHPPRPLPPCPTLIIHGTADEIVPIGGSRAMADEHSHIDLDEVDDDHALRSSVEHIAARCVDFFG